MRHTTPKPFIRPLIICIFASLSCLFFFNYSCFAKDFSSSAAQKMRGMTQQMLDSFSQNYIEIHDPTECISTGGVGSDTCFKVDRDIDVYDAWYPEGCLTDCLSGRYANTAYDTANPFLRSDTQTDEEFGGLQYIYAENYDIEYEPWPVKYTPNGKNSMRKYYWVALPGESYTNGAGETYVATFENLSEPVYFITYDTHQCAHQSEDYCGQASVNPDGVEIGNQFFGAISNNGGNYTKAAEIAGKLTSFCRINGRGEVPVTANASNGIVVGGGSSSSSTDSSQETSASAQAIADKAKELALSESESDYSTPSSAFVDAAKAVGLESTDDCLRFIQVVIKSSGADPDFPTGDYSHNDSGIDEWKTVTYMDDSEIWQRVETTDESELSPGDILVSPVNGVGNNHIFIYLGDGKVAAANSGDHYARIGNLANEWTPKDGSTDEPFKYGGTDYLVYRLGSGGCTTYEGDYPQYYQQTGYTCGPTSMAMLTTAATGQDVLEDDVIDAVGSDMAYANTVGDGMVKLDETVCKQFGCEVIGVNSGSSYSETAELMKKYLNEGYMIHLSGAGSNPFSDVGHYIGIFSINGNKVMTADSANGNQEYDLDDLLSRGYHGNQFSAIKGSGSKNPCEDNLCKEDDSGGLRSGGFTSVEEAEELIAGPYRELSANISSEDWARYNITGGTPYNCFSFSNYFISKYTSIDFHGVGGSGGGGYAENFYNAYSGNYPELNISDTPTPYSVAGCGDKEYIDGVTAISHTFIVLGVDKNARTMIFAQAAYGSGAAGIYAAEVSLDANDPYHVGSRCQYTDFSKYVTGL